LAMKEYDRENVRCVGIFGGGGTGKTSLAEAILFVSGTTTRLGSIDKGNTIMDFEEEEIKRQSSISTAFAHLEWNKVLIHLVDSPGEANFVSDSFNTIHAVDTAIFAVDAVDGVKVQTAKLWDEAGKLGIARMIVVTTLDRDRSDFESALGSIKDLLEIDAVPVTVPITVGEGFVAVADLLGNRMLTYAGDASGKFEAGDLPEEYASRRETLVERIVEADDAVMEKYLEGEKIGDEELLGTFRKGVISGVLVPLFAMSGPSNVGIHPLLDAIISITPNPLERAPLKAVDKTAGEDTDVIPSADGPVLARVVKTVKAFEGMRSVFRVYSGIIRPDSTVYNSTGESKERIGQIRLLSGKEGEAAPYAGPGDIVAATKLKETKTGDIFCSDKKPLTLPDPPKPAPVINFAVEPKSRADEEKIMGALQEMIMEDPSLNVHRDQQTGEFLLAGMGQVHIENAVEKLKRRYNVEVILKEPKVPYRETITKSSRAEGKHKKQTGGRGQFAVAWIELNPKQRDEGYEFIDKIFGGVIPQNFRPAVNKGVQEASLDGVLAGYPVVDFSCTLYDGKTHPVDSSEIAFKVAGIKGFKEAAKDAGLKLLEPIMIIEVTVPDECMGDAIGDLNSRRGRVMGTDQKGGNAIVRATVPMAEILRYSPSLDSMTSGRGSFTVEFDHYEEVPAHIAEKIIASSKKKEDKDED